MYRYDAIQAVSRIAFGKYGCAALERAGLAVAAKLVERRRIKAAKNWMPLQD